MSGLKSFVLSKVILRCRSGFYPITCEQAGSKVNKLLSSTRDNSKKPSWWQSTYEAGWGLYWDFIIEQFLLPSSPVFLSLPQVSVWRILSLEEYAAWQLPSESARSSQQLKNLRYTFLLYGPSAFSHTAFLYISGILIFTYLEPKSFLPWALIVTQVKSWNEKS